MRNKIASSALLVLLALVSGCTARTAYDSLRLHQELECQKMQGAERDQCLRRSDMSYDEYQQQLNKQKQDKMERESRP